MELQGVVDYKECNVGGTVAIEPKMDGWRMHARHVDGVPKLFTRNGHEITLPHIQRELALLMQKGYFFDGELTHPEGRDAIKGAIAHQDEDLNYHVFDMVLDTFFETGLDERPYLTRNIELQKIFNPHDSTRYGEKVWLVPANCIPCAEIDFQYNAFLLFGHEGAVVKNPDSPYTSGPTGDWMRLKPVFTVDCVIMAVERSETDPALASSLIVRDPAGVVSKVHSGMTKQFLRDAIEHPARLVDTVMEASHRGKYTSGKMRHASFVRLRPDKTMTSIGQGVLV